MTGLNFSNNPSSLKPFYKDFVPKNKPNSFLKTFVPLVGLGKYVGNFCGVSCFTSTLGELKNRAAIALPGIGIFINPADVNNISLLRHELGHILQAKKWGKLFFYRYIAKESILSAKRSNHDPAFIHQHTWTEWTANRLSYYFFKRPDDWDMKAYPICPPLDAHEGSEWPEVLRFRKPHQLVRHSAI